MRYSVRHARMRGWIFAAAIVALDQYTKKFFAGSLQPQDSLEILHFFNINLVYNRGISFGMLAGDAPWLPLFLIIATSVIVFLLILWMKRAKEQIIIISLGSIIGGAIGNIVDRVHYGFVIDFLDFHWGRYHWPAFNIADSAVFMGVVILILMSIVRPETDL